MNFQPFKDLCHCRRRNLWKMPVDILPLHLEGHIFPSADGLQYGQVTGIEKIESVVRTILFLLRTDDIIQFLSAATVVIKGENELKVVIVRRFQDCEQLVQAVDALL